MTHQLACNDDNCNEMVEEQRELLAVSHPCNECGAESRYLWMEGQRPRQACDRCAPAWMLQRAA